MQYFPNQLPVDVQDIQEVIKKIFTHDPTGVERVTEGGSTFVYRIIFPHETFYLSILPEEGEQGYLAHGDFDTTHIYQDNGRYTGIIDFGEIRGADRWYDLGYFHMRGW